MNEKKCTYNRESINNIIFNFENTRRGNIDSKAEIIANNYNY